MELEKHSGQSVELMIEGFENGISQTMFLCK